MRGQVRQAPRRPSRCAWANVSMTHPTRSLGFGLSNCGGFGSPVTSPGGVTGRVGDLAVEFVTPGAALDAGAYSLPRTLGFARSSQKAKTEMVCRE